MSEKKLSTPVPSTLVMEEIDLTPDLARHLLGQNQGNRDVRAQVVKALARDMSAGNWRLTSESIKIDTNDVMIDGQHRCLAVIESGVTIRVVLAIGLEPEVQAVIDTPANRSAQDALRFAGVEKYRAILASMARLAAGVDSGNITHSLSTNIGKITNTEAQNWVQSHPLATVAAELGTKARVVGFPPSPFAYAAYRLLEVDQEAAIEFIDSLISFNTNGPGDPRYSLLNWIGRVRQQRRMPLPAEVIFVVFRVWNAWRLEKSLSSIVSAGRAGDGATIPELV